MSGGWNRDNHVSTQAPKYHGLVNQGATCYLNSVLQVLFMTEDFRKAVERSADENPDTIDGHLKSLFSDLQKYPTYTFKITRALDIDSVYEQRDAAEYIEKILRKTSDGASQIFHGLMSHRTICRTCGTQTDRDEAFWHLPLALVDSCSDVYSVVDGIRDFFKVSVFSGENQIYCDTCDDKVDATAQYVMKHHPDVLILLLKRFEFSYHHMSYVKIHHVVDVPFTIQIPERQYKLYAVVDHSGDLRGGHYTATIKDEDEDRWYHFNDSRVSLYDVQPFQMDHTERSQTSQLLFYRNTEEAVNQDNMSTNHNQCEDAEKTRQRDEGEDDSETGDDTAVAVSVAESEVKGNKDVVRDVSRGAGLSEEPGNEGNVIQAEIHKNQEDNEESKNDNCQDASIKAEPDDQTQNVRLASVEIKQTESIKNETAESDTDRERRLNANSKPEVSDQPKICDLPNQQEKTNDTQSRIMDNDEMTGDKESEKPSIGDFNRAAEYSREGGLEKQIRNEDEDSNLKTGQQFEVRVQPAYLNQQDQTEKQNRNKDQGSNLKTRQHFDPGHVDKEGDEKMKTNIEGNTERETGAIEFPSESVKPLTKHDSEYKKKSSSRLDKNPDVRPNMSQNSSVEFLSVKEEDNVETVRYELKKDNKGSCKDETVGNYARSKPDNQECKRDISQPLGRHVEDKKKERNDSKRDGGHDQRRGSARKDSESGKGEDRRRIDEGIGQKNVKKQAKEKEGTVRGDRENQKRGSGQRSVHNKRQDSQLDVGSVQHSDKGAGPAKTNKRKRSSSSSIKKFLKKKPPRTGVAGESSNSSRDDRNTDSLTESVSSLVLTEPSHAKTNKHKGLRVKLKAIRRQHGKKEENKEIAKHNFWCSCVSKQS